MEEEEWRWQPSSAATTDTFFLLPSFLMLYITQVIRKSQPFCPCTIAWNMTGQNWMYKTWNT